MEKQTFIVLLILTCATAFQFIATLFLGNIAFAALCAAFLIPLYKATDKAWKEAHNGK